MTSQFRLKADSEFKLSVAPDLYAVSLRAIGQDLAKISPEKFEIEVAGEDFVARGYGLQQRLRAKGTDENPLAKVRRSIAHDQGMPDAPHSRSSIAPFVRTYTPADICRLDEAARSRRDGRNKNAPDFYSLGERLRTIGRIVDAEKCRLLKLCKDGNSLTFEYEDRGGQTRKVDHSNFALYRIQGGHRSQRRTGDPKDAWEGLDL